MVTEEDIIRRNQRVEQLFAHFDMPVRLIGDINTPAIIYKDLYCLCCYVKNFYLIFTDKPFNGNTLGEIKLTREITCTKEEILALLDQGEHRLIHKIKVKDSELFLSGYNFLDKKNLEGRYPVFARFGYKIYFDKEYAQTIVDSYPDYNLEVV